MTSARLLRTQINLRRERGANRAAASKILLGTNAALGGNALKEREAARRFSFAVSKIPTGALATAADRSKETVKGWRSGRQCPNTASLINMARRLPSVKAWLYEECEKKGEPVNSEHAFKVAVAALVDEATKPGPLGDYARTILSGRTFV